MTSNSSLIIASGVVATICMGLLIVVCSTPSYYHLQQTTNGFAVDLQVGAFRYCTSASIASMTSPHATLSSPHATLSHRLFSSLQAQQSGNGGTIATNPSSSSIPLNPACIAVGITNQTTCHNYCFANSMNFDTCYPAIPQPVAGGGNSEGSNSNPPVTASESTTTNSNPSGVPLCGTMSTSDCRAFCNTSPSQLQQCKLSIIQQATGCSDVDGKFTNANQDDKNQINSIRAFLLLAIILSFFAIIVSVLSLFLSSHAYGLLISGCVFSIMAGFAGAISWSIVAGEMGQANLWWGFGLQVGASTLLWFVGGMLGVAGKTAKANQVTSDIALHTKTELHV